MTDANRSSVFLNLAKHCNLCLIRKQMCILGPHQIATEGRVLNSTLVIRPLQTVGLFGVVFLYLFFIVVIFTSAILKEMFQTARKVPQRQGSSCTIGLVCSAPDGSRAP